MNELNFNIRVAVYVFTITAQSQGVCVHFYVLTDNISLSWSYTQILQFFGNKAIPTKDALCRLWCLPRSRNMPRERVCLCYRLLSFYVNKQLLVFVQVVQGFLLPVSLVINSLKALVRIANQTPFENEKCEITLLYQQVNSLFHGHAIGL